MNYLEMKNKPSKGDKVFVIEESFPSHSKTPLVKIRQRIVQSVDENGAWFQLRPEFESFQFLFPTEEDALLFVNKNTVQ
jgi:hypothetical protein